MLPAHASTVIIGAGIVGCSAAAALAQRGARDIVVIEQGPLFATGGSTSHAPGLVFQTNASQTMCALARASVTIYRSLAIDGAPAFVSVGSLEVAQTPARWRHLAIRQGYARSWGLTGELIGPDEAARLAPLLDARQILGAYAVPSDGVARAVLAAEALASRAAPAASFHGGVEVTGVEVSGGRVRAVITSAGRIAAERVLLCAGIWGPKIGAMAGVPIPLTPVQHQYVRTGPLAALAGAAGEIAQSIVRHQDRRLYVRQHGEQVGIGSYAHAPILTAPDQIHRHGDGPTMPSVVPFTPDDFAQPWRDAVALIPALGDAEIASAINGLFSFTPDGNPLVGESPDVRGLWVAEAVWVTHAAGVGEQVAAWMIDGAPTIDLHACDLSRFEAHAATPAYVRERGAQQYREVYNILHPMQPLERPRPLRVSPFFARQQQLGAHFLEARGWERPHWYDANAALLDDLGAAPQRSAWAAQHWSPAIIAEQRATRERVALFDMTPLARCEVAGPGALALLNGLATNQLDRPVGSLTYTAMVDDDGRLISDLTVTRLAKDRFWVAHNGPTDLAYLRQRAGDSGAQLSIEDRTGGTCCVGVWGPRARELVQSLSDDDLSTTAFPYLSARRIAVGEVPVLALRVSYVGELGYELYASAEYGLRLWDLLWDAGRPLGVAAAGRGAFDVLRLEKGYRSYGSDMRQEHDPYEAGIGFTVKLGKAAFRGREALSARKAAGLSRKLCCLIIDDGDAHPLGGEPILADDDCVGYVTSAADCAALGLSIFYSYLPIDRAGVGDRLALIVEGVRYGASVVAEPLFDPPGQRLRV